VKDLNAGVHVSPNIQSDSEVYEIENIACDPEKKIETFLKSVFNWSGKRVLDVGCGTGFHLPYYASEASHVFGVEPHDSSRIKAMKRISELEVSNVSILKGTAESVTLKNESVDLAYSRFAYFWGAGCEQGVKEIFRVLKPGGLFVMIDNNLERGTFGAWVKESFRHSDIKQQEVDAFWKSQGFEIKTIDSCWSFKTREDLENVLRMESPKMYLELLSRHKGLTIDYSFNLYFKTKPFS